jgi:hypothetical protein
MSLKHFKELNLEKSILTEEWLENKIKAITESNIVKNFPDEQADLEWIGGVIDLLEFLGL